MGKVRWLRKAGLACAFAASLRAGGGARSHPGATASAGAPPARLLQEDPGGERPPLDGLPFYVGQEICGQCHRPAGAARVCTEKRVPKHDGSYRALYREEAAHIAYLSGEPETPTSSLICLGCHAASGVEGRRWVKPSFTIADGVQCETCHGPGSLHVDAHRAGARRAESRPPESPLDRIEDDRYGNMDLLRTEKASFCLSCHIERPSHRQVLTEGYRRPDADLLYKTPINLTVSPSGDRLYVVCENSNSVLVIDPRARRVLREIAVGRRPQDAALSPDGRTLYVTNRMSGTLSTIDLDTGSSRSEVRVGDEPHGVLTDRTGKRVFVLNTGQDQISVVDAASLTEVKRLAAGNAPWSLALGGDGALLLVTNALPYPSKFLEPPRSEVTQIAPLEGRVVLRTEVDGANMLEGIAYVDRSGVALFTLMRTKNLVPISRLAQGWVVTNGLGVLWPDGHVDQVLLDEPSEAFPDPSDIAVSPDGRSALVTSAGADEVAVIDISRLLSTVRPHGRARNDERMSDRLGLSGAFVTKRIAVGRNPRGVSYSPDGRFAYVAEALDDAVAIIETAGWTLVGRIDLGGPREITETRRGQRLFHSALSTFGRQFSCRSCHPDGHLNGLTFDIEADGIGLRPSDNRTLQGILDTAPFKWEGTNPTLARQCGPRLAIFFTRLEPFEPEDLSALVRYISTIERPPNHRRGPDGLSTAQRRGQLIFQRAISSSGHPIPVAKRCDFCHGTGYGTSRISSAVGTEMWFDAPAVDAPPIDLSDEEALGALGIVYFSQDPRRLKAFDIPHLVGISSGAPYLHNGSAPTLEEIWTRFSLYDYHGVVGDLSRGQFNDLIAYLKAL